jgi:hypothetical protein
MTTTETTLGLRATARAIGISHPALLKAESDGRVPKRVAGMFNVEACKEALRLNSHTIKSQAARSQQKAAPEAPEPQTVAEFIGATQPADPESLSVAEAVRQLEWEKLRALKRKGDREEGRLVDIVAVNAFVAGMIMKARDELARIGAELADKLSQEVDPVKCRSHVDDRIFQVLANLKEYRSA